MADDHHATVFISHAGPDSASARMIAEGLATCGIHARLDQAEIKAGTNIILWMNDTVAESDYVLALLSPCSVGRYWVEMESNALMKEADLRRTFVITALLPGLEDAGIPFLLRARAFVDFRQDQEKALLELVSRFKDDELVRRDLGRYPTPAPASMQVRIEKAFPDGEAMMYVLIHCNRFGRSFRLHVPVSAAPSYLMGMLRDELHLRFSNVDDALGVELSYTYYLKHKGESLTLNKPLGEAGVRDGDRLEFWIRVTLRDLVEDKEIGEKMFFQLYGAEMDKAILSARKRAFSSGEIAGIARRFFAHVDR